MGMMEIPNILCNMWMYIYYIKAIGNRETGIVAVQNYLRNTRSQNASLLWI